MEEKNVNIRFHRASSKSELSPDDLALFEKAISAMDTAYAPYSKFQVGCAIQLENGVVVTGSNQENIAYPSGLCAERVAIFAASSQYPRVKILTLAVATTTIGTDSEATVSPCGSCRQVMVEYERLQEPSFRVLTGAAAGVIDIFESAEALLPLAFYDSGLSKQ